MRRLYLEAAGIFIAASIILFALGPTAPFSKELGVCESGAVRDVLAGNLILPRFIPGPIVHVPPLYWWVTAVCVRLIGWSELAFRIPALVPAALTCATVYAWTAARLGRAAALCGAVALLLCHFFIDAARQPRMDSMLAMFVTAAAVSLEAGLSSSRRSFLVAAALAIGMAFAAPTPATALETVAFSGYSPGTVVVVTHQRRLYYVLGNGQAIRYPVGVGRSGKQWAGSTRIDGKYVKPDWSPPREVRRDIGEPLRGRLCYHATLSNGSPPR